MTRIEREAHLEEVMARINAIMKERHISQAELARRANMNPADVSKALKLKVDPRTSTLIAILKALDHHMSVTPDQSSIGE